ncbi:hypothetical protein Dacet_1962 [Denitrovibrio acetiphilus DSM 12809]|uniref:EF-hand domain-containing protein n=1 Tax=Denitrovibrio acetiphilus (strain DSM 12809 / NBRC 114555 / N2460) TaxID=522772 RepID=D4H1G5_DENA2|nr:EF-hand domain-containing protein [Denitrovibrio acetiphilus]ADD68725.1 hypothetical protein Dacet_1962 [Denitrovibrio acetiphilus DSM 12809]
MSISSIGMSYSQLQTSSELTIKGQGSNSSESTKETDSAVKSSGSMDSVSLSAETSQSYAIGGDTVSKSEFDQYDKDGDGEISASEQAAYEADQVDEADEDDTQAALIEAMEDAQDEVDEETEAVYSPYGEMSVKGESGTQVNATA